MSKHMALNVVNFYRTGDEYGFLSNFAPYPIVLGGKTWPTSEHYFQAQKFAGTAYEELIRLQPSPALAARIGRETKVQLRSDWDAVKDQVMREAVRAKFCQHADLREKLLATGDASIVERTERDAYWGDGGDGSGKNMLGRILMEIRREFWGQP